MVTMLYEKYKGFLILPIETWSVGEAGVVRTRTGYWVSRSLNDTQRPFPSLEAARKWIDRTTGSSSSGRLTQVV